MTPSSPSIALVEYSDLVAGNEHARGAVATAFGEHPACLGIILVKGVPGYQERRQALLPLAQKLAGLDHDTLENLNYPGASESFGWSHGKERFAGKFGQWN